jgi:3-oxoacyl-[acyl-carrier protein] reductase
MSETNIRTIPIYPDLSGKVAVVTGGSKGIGAATCRVLAANGVAVAVVARDLGGITQVVQALERSGARAIGISADMVRSGEADRVRTEVESALGPADILIAFAGGFGRHSRVLETSEAEWREVIDSNLTSTFLTCRAFLPGMVERKRGVIVTMASIAGRVLESPGGTASYSAAKAGIIMFTRHAAREVGKFGVRVNCVAPATTMTERVERITPSERLQQLADLAPMKRIGMPDDTALATLFLVSESASWLTGITVDVTGGRAML